LERFVHENPVPGMKNRSGENSIYSREGEATLDPTWTWRRTTTMVLVMVRQLEKRTLLLPLLPPFLRT
jgi:hypothetical protein